MSKLSFIIFCSFLIVGCSIPKPTSIPKIKCRHVIDSRGVIYKDCIGV